VGAYAVVLYDAAENAVCGERREEGGEKKAGDMLSTKCESRCDHGQRRCKVAD